MDFSDSTRVIYNRIRKLEPENATKIIGYLFLHDHGEHEMIRLAFSPDSAIQSLIVKAKADLGLSDNPNGLGSVPSQYSYLNGVYSGSSYCPKPMVASAPELPVKVCHYFVKGFCKHGSNCRYFHGQCSPVAESFPPQFNTGSGDDHGALSNGSLEKLEMEITELLKSRGGSPVSIATLPMLYYEKYGYALQADGYLTESQRHGKAGFSLSKLLSRLKNSIHLIDRPHGQHSVILAKDAYKYLDHDRSDSGGIVSGSRQIYLTFPAESGFTEQDVSNYFNKFGPVQDVRIPGQQKRMFGFVTFIFPETAKQILAKGNPHFICGSRVLVKPYKDKSRLPDRKCTDKMQNNAIHNPQVLLEGESDVQSMPRYSSDIPRVHGNEPVDDQELQFDFERMHLGEFQLAPSSLAYRRYIPFSNQSRLSKVRAESSPDRTGYFFDAVNNGSNGKDQLLHLGNNCSDHQDSGQGINLPESPFASIIV